MSVTRQRLPLTRAELSRGPRPGDYITRAAYAKAFHISASRRSKSPEAVARERWGDDPVTPLLLRAPSTPATTTDNLWAAGLARTAAGDFVASLAPLSAGAQVLSAATQVSLDGYNTVSFPRRAGPIDPTKVPFVPETGSIP